MPMLVLLFYLLESNAYVGTVVLYLLGRIGLIPI